MTPDLLRRTGLFLATTVATALVAVALVAVAPTSRAATVEQRVHVQVRNVTQGQELRLQVADPGVVALRIADIRLGRTAERLEDGAVRLDGNALVITTEQPRLNLNITLHAVCEAACPAVIAGGIELPRASYAMLRTAVQDVALTRSGPWSLKLSDG